MILARSHEDDGFNLQFVLRSKEYPLVLLGIGADPGTIPERLPFGSPSSVVQSDGHSSFGEAVSNFLLFRGRGRSLEPDGIFGDVHLERHSHIKRAGLIAIGCFLSISNDSKILDRLPQILRGKIKFAVSVLDLEDALIDL